MTEAPAAGNAPAAAVPGEPDIPAGRRASMVDSAYALLKRKILDNEMPPGFSALEQELALQLGMSRTPVREALVRLRDEGLVEIVPRRGMRVLALSAADMREIYEVLGCVEARAVERLAAAGPEAAPVLAELDAAVGRMEAALAADDLDAWAAADERFHNLLVERCGNRRLAQIAATCRDQAHRVRMFTLHLRPKPLVSTRDHRHLVELLRRGDGRAAREAHWEHRDRLAGQLMEILRRFRLRHL